MSSHESSSAIYWIHCNQCYANYIHKDRNIFILSCYHVVCEKCGLAVNPDKIECPLCKNQSGKRLICNNLSPKVKQLFQPRPWTLDFVASYTTVQFQTNQRNHFMMGCQKMNECSKAMDTKRNQSKEECRQKYILRQKIQQEHLQLAAVLKKYLKEKTNIKPKRAQMSISSDTMESFSTIKTGPPKHYRRTIPPTYHGPNIEHSFDFPNESHFSKSFIL